MPGKQYAVGEVVSRRSQNAKHYYNADGKFTAEISSSPIHYRDDKGNWQDIDNNLMASEEPGSKLRNAANEFKTYFAADAAKTPLVRVQSKQISLTLSPIGAAPAAAASTGPSVVYRGALAEGAADLRYTVRNTGLKQDIILKSYKTNAFEFKLNTGGLRPELDRAGDLALYSASGSEVVRAKRPFAVDAANKIIRDASFALTKQGSEHLLTITVDRAWLQAKDRAWPVTVDPWWVFIRGASADSYLDSKYPDAKYGESLTEPLRVGYDTNYGPQVFRTVVKFDLSSIPVEQRIIAGQFWMKLSSGGLPDDGHLKAGAYRIIMDWQESTVSWNYPWGPGSPGGAFDPNPAPPGPPLAFYNTTAGVGHPNSNRATWWVTDIVREWYAGGANYGLLIESQDEGVYRYKVYHSTETASGDTNAMPTLWVMYEAGFAGIQDYWTYVNFPLGDGQVAMVNVAGGNMVLKHRDWSIASTGIDTVIDRVYNSSDGGSHDFGYGAMASIRPEMTTFATALPRARLYFDPGATWHAFEPIPDNNGNPLASTYYRPRGLKAGLSVSGNYYSVNYDSGLTFKFDSSQSYRLQTAADRNNNSISYQYTSGKMTSVTDTVGRILTFGRASGDIDSISDWTQPVPRTTSYTYNPSVNFFTNQNSGRTEYRDLPDYSGVAIVDPKKQNDDPNFGRSDTPTSEWTWTDPFSTWNRVGTFSYIGYNGAQQFKETYTFSYPGPNTTVVTDPRGNQTTYTWDPRTGVVTQVQDAMNKSELREYNYNLDLVKTSDRQGNEWRRDYEVYGQNLD
ncbi:MAG: DNRLRE domain-containing protein, partial [Chloroflexi bacterium]|nr:DNRLRE domain-containing protein [Chloroflexota bacterium]